MMRSSAALKPFREMLKVMASPLDRFS